MFDKLEDIYYSKPDGDVWVRYGPITEILEIYF